MKHCSEFSVQLFDSLVLVDIVFIALFRKEIVKLFIVLFIVLFTFFVTIVLFIDYDRRTAPRSRM